VENVKNRPLSDVQNAKVSGIARKNAKLVIGQTIKQPATKRRSSSKRHRKAVKKKW
jgi:hypothetical protein